MSFHDMKFLTLISVADILYQLLTQLVEQKYTALI